MTGETAAPVGERVVLDAEDSLVVRALVRHELLGRALLGVAAGRAVPGAAVGVAAWRGNGCAELLSRAGAALARATAAGDERLRAG